MVAKPDRRRMTGLQGESLAAQYMEQNGYSILDRNWRCRSGELDIVAVLDDSLVFVEVRTRKSISRFGTPAESVDERKQRQVRQTAQVYLMSKRLNEQRSVRFDVITVHLYAEQNAPKIEHYENAF